MGTGQQEPDIKHSRTTNSQNSGDITWSKVAVFLGALASVVALLTWFGVSNVGELVKPSPTKVASHSPSPIPTNTIPTQALEECQQAMDTEETGFATSTRGLPSPGSQSADIEARDEMAAEAETTSTDLNNEANVTTNNQVKTDIRNLASDFQSLASALKNSMLPTTQQSDQISADSNSLTTDCNDLLR